MALARETGMDELERFKREINLVDYAAACGYQVDRRESSRGSVVMRKATTDDKIIVARSAADGHWTYFSVRDQADNGSIVDFLQRRRSLSLGHLRRELRPWVGQPAGAEVPLWMRDVTALPKDRAGVGDAYRAASVTADVRYLKSRGIRPATLSDPKFAGTFRVDGRGNVLFPHHDRDGELCGFEIGCLGNRDASSTLPTFNTLSF